MKNRLILPLGLLLATLTAACTPQELEAVGRVILEEALKPEPTATGASPSPTPSGSPMPGTVSPSPTPTSATAKPAPSAVPGDYTADERELYRLLMAYRAEKGLPAIALSPSLTTVSRTHVEDLLAHPPDGEVCNLHTWSSDGPWSSGCYTRDHAQAVIMWDKPRELTDYPGNGYEIAVGYYGDKGARGKAITPESAMASWKGSSGHNAVMINLGTWEDTSWKAVGVGINEDYAAIWFGKESDPAL